MAFGFASRLSRAAAGRQGAGLRWYLLQVTGLVALWFASSITISFLNKRLFNAGLKYPFFHTAFINGGVAAITWVVTRAPALRQPLTPFPTMARIVAPIGLATMLDIAFSNWSLMFLSISLHTIIKGAAPLAVMLCGMGFGLERPSRSMPLVIALLVSGLGLVAGDRLSLPDRPVGILLGLISVGFTGLRWSLTQLLLSGRPADTTEASGQGVHLRQGAPAAPPTPKQHPLSTMLSVTPITAASALVACATSDEREVFALMASDPAGTLLPYLGFLGVVCSLVWLLIMAEFVLVRLTSSLTLSIFGVAKELLTVLIAVIAGESLSSTNATRCAPRASA